MVIAGCKNGNQVEAPSPQDQELRAIAKEAYLYGFPIVDSYRIQYTYFVDQGNPEYKGAWNTVHNTARVYTPNDKAVQTPNSDTPYSFIGADLRAEPIVISVPEVPKGRYYSLQFIDWYTFNFGYVGSRATGNDAGNYLLAGPKWTGDTPKNVKSVLRSETDFDVVAFRTQLFNPADIENVRKIQAGYKVQPLSKFLGKPAPPSAPPVDFMKPVSADEEKTSLKFYDLLNFVMRYCSIDPSEKDLMARLAKLGIGPDPNFVFNSGNLTPQVKQALQDGMADAWKAFNDYKAAEIDAGKLTSAQVFGTRVFLQNNYMNRMIAAVLGIYGNSQDEAFYPLYFNDSAGQKLTGANRYTLHFSPGQFPPVNAFWSLTMYELPQSLLVANPLNRYLINSPMLPHLKKDADGGFTLYIQHDSPGKEKEPNWLPAPSGPFLLTLRLYWPKPEALSGVWKAPPVQRVS
jgi:hypothetical protein